MRITTFSLNGTERLGLVDGDMLLDVAEAASALAIGDAPAQVLDLISQQQQGLDLAAKVLLAAKKHVDANYWHKLSAVKLLAPIPTMRKNVFCVGRNYKLHIEEAARARGAEPTFPKVPEFFTKPPTSVIGHSADVEIAQATTAQLDYEVELAIVVGKRCRDVKVEDALSVVFGYTILNDVSARDLQRAHGQFFKGKALDGSCPIGPWIVTSDEFGNPSGHQMALRVNGETRQSSTTADMLFNCSEIIASLSVGLTLEPGDIIATGTPSGVGLGMSPPTFLNDGDKMEAEIAGIGVLVNTVRRA